MSPGLHDTRLIRDVAIVATATLRETRGLPAIVLFREADVVSSREERSTRRQKDGGENPCGRQPGAHASHDAGIVCIESANQTPPEFAMFS
jgi:hypothetical protein